MAMANNPKAGKSSKNDSLVLPHLPPIIHPDSVISRELTPTQKKLLRHRRGDVQRQPVEKVMLAKALKVYKATAEHNRQRVPSPPEPQLPSTMNSKEKKIRENYLALKRHVERRPVAPMPPSWKEAILRLLPVPLRQEELLTELLQEVDASYLSSMRRSTVQYILVKPNVKGLENEDISPPPREPEGLDFSSPWRDSFEKARKYIKGNLHVTHLALRSILDMGHTVLSQTLLLDLSGYRAMGPLELTTFSNNVTLDMEKGEEKLMRSWFPHVVSLFSDNQNSTEADSSESFHGCVSTLLSNQLRDLLVHTIEAYVRLFDLDDQRVGAAYDAIPRAGDASWLGENAASWCLEVDERKLAAMHGGERHPVETRSSSVQRVGLFLDWEAGTLSFYHADTVRLLYSFSHRFTEPLLPALGLYDGGRLVIIP